MRLWSLDPAQLDRAALVSGWREGLLAQAVLLGRTKGYTRHPQLVRFRQLDDPVVGVATWLLGLAEEADRRGYRFDRSRVVPAPDPTLRMTVTEDQLRLEWRHLLAKCRHRSPDWAADLMLDEPRAHPIFDVVSGPVADWERATS
ncbi:pyrimidine dimer DNA glycosylase/endonuclease V [Janibacter cremeus]|uniref:pyrimidine dimer DNA glycosylase/endonuclease V n=1 Tax=Janibacter cremeus TaxID=1285192 RepID=UPI0023F75C13|nr:pyrimidine dimer DNA glycosylase/endonuclease V [Janibacter cremeus]WEV76777.1 pyrimidine dimer DNA glycosylase/endonuclease V [Janibacter cremeus]